MKPRLIVLVLAVVLTSPLILLAALAGAPEPALAVSDRLPDLRMAHLKDFRVQSTGGRRLLRFDSIIVNVGVGKFEARGSRPDSSTSDMTVTQRIYNDAGGFRDNPPSDAIMYFAGDGHAHWHVRDLEHYRLRPLNSSTTLRTGAKHGFCFYDNYPFGSSQGPFYSGCGGPGDLRVTMGLSVGWGDIYDDTLPDQYIDITGLSGDYRLRAEADKDKWFQESNESNNFTWVNLRLQGNRVSVLKQGPGA